MEFVERMVERYEGFQILVNHDAEAIERRNAKRLYPELKLEGEKLYEARRGDESDSEDGFQEITVNPVAVEEVRGFLASAARDWDHMEKASQEHHPLTPAPLAEVGDRLRGTCCAWDHVRGVGWIQPDSGLQKIFVHHNEVEGHGRVHLTVGQHVLLTVGKDEKGPNCGNMCQEGVRWTGHMMPKPLGSRSSSIEFKGSVFVGAGSSDSSLMCRATCPKRSSFIKISCSVTSS